MSVPTVPVTIEPPGNEISPLYQALADLRRGTDVLAEVVQALAIRLTGLLPPVAELVQEEALAQAPSRNSPVVEELRLLGYKLQENITLLNKLIHELEC